MTGAGVPSTTILPITVERRAPDAVRIRWNPGHDGPVEIFHGPVPESIAAQAAAVVSGRAGGATLTGLSPARPAFFRLVAGGRSVLVGERCLPVDGVTNLRDLGGYETADGRRVRWGSLYRSANLGRVTADGLVALRQLGIRMVCDFRTEPESTKLPNLFPDTPQIAYLRLPIQHGEHEPTAVFERIRNGDYHWISEQFMLDGYIEGIDRYPHVWARFACELARPAERPALFHCTGGKDRTGAAAALLLLVLGVPEETVIADYGLSDACNTEVRRRVYEQLRRLNVDIAAVAPYFTAPPSRLRALLDYLRRTYGTVEDYLVRTAGVEPDVIAALRDNLLEE